MRLLLRWRLERKKVTWIGRAYARRGLHQKKGVLYWVALSPTPCCMDCNSPVRRSRRSRSRLACGGSRVPEKRLWRAARSSRLGDPVHLRDGSGSRAGSPESEAVRAARSSRLGDPVHLRDGCGSRAGSPESEAVVEVPHDKLKTKQIYVHSRGDILHCLQCCRAPTRLRPHRLQRCFSAC